MHVSDSCADPESFARGSDFDNVFFFFFLREEGTNKYHYKRAPSFRKVPFEWSFAGGPQMTQQWMLAW